MCNALDVATRTDVADVPGRATHVGCNHQVPGLECLTEHTIGRGKPCTTRMSPCLAHSRKFPNLVAKSGYPRPVRTTPGAHSGNLSSLHAAIISTMPMMMHSTVQCGTVPEPLKDACVQRHVGFCPAASAPTQTPYAHSFSTTNTNRAAPSLLFDNPCL